MTGQYLLSQAGSTALLCAGWKGHSEVVRLLLQAGARDIPDKVVENKFLRAVVKTSILCYAEWEHSTELGKS